MTDQANKRALLDRPSTAFGSHNRTTRGWRSPSGWSATASPPASWPRELFDHRNDEPGRDLRNPELRSRLAGAGIALGHGAAEAILKGFVEQLIKARRRDQEHGS